MNNCFIKSKQAYHFIYRYVPVIAPTIYQVNFNLAHYQSDFFTQYNIKLPTSLTHAVKKRQAEFLAGRYAASLGLKSLGYESTQIPSGQNREPVWPKNIIGSITHTHDTAFCVLVKKTQADYVGIDYENVLNLEFIQEIKNSIVNQNEELILRQSNMAYEKAFTLTFSAKESLFKALYPQVGYYFDFTDVEITTISTNNQSFDLILKKSLTSNLPSETRIRGYYNDSNQSVLTLVSSF